MLNFNNFINKILLEKKIEVGGELTKRLNLIDPKIGDKVKNFLNSENIKDDAKVSKIDYENDNKLITVYDEKGGARKMKLGKLLSYLGFENEIKGYEMENIISVLKPVEEKEELVLVKGNDIKKAYYQRNYCEEVVKGHGGLFSSCMRFSRSQFFLDIYTKNPNQVSCLVMFDDDKKVKGRALIWKLDDGTRFMDRIYTADKNDRSVFLNYAIKNKIDTTIDTQKYITLDYNDFELYPYVDTFSFYDKEEGVLSNKEMADDNLRLNSTNGTAENDGTTVWCELLNEYILEDEATEVYRDGESQWVYTHDVLKIDYYSPDLIGKPKRAYKYDAVDIGNANFYIHSEDVGIFSYDDYEGIPLINVEYFMENMYDGYKNQFTEEMLGVYIEDEFIMLENVVMCYELEEKEFQLGDDYYSTKTDGIYFNFRYTDDSFKKGYSKYFIPRECFENSGNLETSYYINSINLPIIKPEFNISKGIDKNGLSTFFVNSDESFIEIAKDTYVDKEFLEKNGVEKNGKYKSFIYLDKFAKLIDRGSKFEGLLLKELTDKVFYSLDIEEFRSVELLYEEIIQNRKKYDIDLLNLSLDFRSDKNLSTKTSWFSYYKYGETKIFPYLYKVSTNEVVVMNGKNIKLVKTDDIYNLISAKMFDNKRNIMNFNRFVLNEKINKL